MNPLHQKIIEFAAQDDKTAIQSEDYRLSYHALLNEIKTVSNQFIDQNKPPQTVALLLDNQIAWAVLDLALMFKKQVTVPLPPFFSATQLKHVINDAAVETLIIDKKYQALIEQSNVLIKDQQEIKVAGKILIKLMLETTHKTDLSAAKITYTSGTTGAPKGVILSTKTILTKVSALAVASLTTSDDLSLSILPLSTLLENIGGLYVALYCGATVTLLSPETLGMIGSSKIESEKLLQAITIYQPTAFIIIPQLLLLFLQAIKQGYQLPKSVRFIAMGGAPVSEHLLTAAAQLQLPIFEGYGLSEAASVVAVNTPDNYRLGSVGKVLPNHQVKVLEDGSILVKNNLFQGYLGNENQADHFYDTGDLGRLDKAGYLYLMGRKKNIINTTYGRNISPEWIEKELETIALIAQCIVVGHGRSFLSAIIVPRITSGMTVETYQQPLTYALAQMNKPLPDYAQVQQFILATEPFSLENGQLTGTGRPKRAIIEAAYSSQINHCYKAG